MAKINRQIPLRGLILLLGGFVAFLSWTIQVSENPAYAQQATPTPTPTVTPPIGWHNQTSSRIPSRLQRTAISGERGAGGLDDWLYADICNTFFVTDPGVEAWGVTYQEFHVGYSKADFTANHPGISNPVIRVASCGGRPDPNTVVILTDPNGNVLEMETYIFKDPGSDLSGVGYSYQVMDAGPFGFYQLDIIQASRNYSKRYEIVDFRQEFWGPMISIEDSDTALSPPLYRPGESIQLEYRIQQPDWVRSSKAKPVEVGLYRVVSEGDVPDTTDAYWELVTHILIDSWTIETDEEGNYRQEITIPPDAPEGDYFLAVAYPNPSHRMEPFEDFLWLVGSGEELYSLQAFSVSSLPPAPVPVIAVNQTVEGVFRTDEDQVRYRFEGKAGETIRAHLSVAGIDVARLELWGPGNTNEAAYTHCDFQLQHQLPEDGTYTLVFELYPNSTITSDSSYSLQLSSIEEGQLSTAQAIGVSAIVGPFGVGVDNLRGFISCTWNSWTLDFIGQAGETVRAEVFAERLGSPLDSVLILTDLDGNELAANDDAVGLDSVIEYELPVDGVYRLEVKDLNEGAGPDYWFELELTEAGLG